MIEKPIPLKIPPGIFRNGTEYQSKGRWYDCNLMRWEKGSFGPMGGWKPVLDAGNAPMSVGAPARGAHAWQNNSRIPLFAIGTFLKQWAISTSGSLVDITPASFVTGREHGSYVTGTSNLYGNGFYNAGPYSAGLGVRRFLDADVWHQDNLDDKLYSVFTADGRLLKYTGSGVSTVVTNAPTGNLGVVVSPDRFIMVLGAGGNPRKVAWPDRNNDTVWTASDDNEAGDVFIQSESGIVCGKRTRRGVLILTFTDAHFSTYVGGIQIHSFDPVGRQCGVLSAHAATVVDDVVFWMGDKQFYMFASGVEPIPCDVADHVFDNLNTDQRGKIFSYSIPSVSTVYWHYPTKGSTTLECDSYVSYNWLEKHWAIGKLERASGFGPGVWGTPVLVKPAGHVMAHETGSNYDGLIPFASSGPVEIGEGEQVMTVNYVIPDETAAGAAEVEFFVKNQPEDAERHFGPFSLSKLTPVRFKARQARVNVREVRNVVQQPFENGNFEIGGDSPLAIDSRWRRASSQGDSATLPVVNYGYEKSNPLAGARSLRLSPKPAQPTAMQNVDLVGTLRKIALEPGDEVRIEATSKLSGLTNAEVFLQFYTTNGSVTGGALSLAFSNPAPEGAVGLVTTKNATAFAPLDAVSMSLFVRATFSGTIQGEALFDDIVVTRIVPRKWRIGTFRLGALPGGRR